MNRLDSATENEIENRIARGHLLPNIVAVVRDVDESDSSSCSNDGYTRCNLPPSVVSSTRPFLYQ
jgi:hypothetical protein